MRVITFDIETMGELHGGGFDINQQELTVVCIHDTTTNEITGYTKETLNELWPILEQADMLVGYNSDHFDIPILNKYYVGDLTHIKSLDLLKEIKEVLGRRLKLDTIAEGTLGTHKSGHGLQAVEWWKNGEYDKVMHYCKDDVKITRAVYDYVRKHNSLKYKDYDGIKEIKIDASKWEEDNGTTAAMTHTLPW